MVICTNAHADESHDSFYRLLLTSCDLFLPNSLTPSMIPLRKKEFLDKPARCKADTLPCSPLGSGAPNERARIYGLFIKRPRGLNTAPDGNLEFFTKKSCVGVPLKKNGKRNIRLPWSRNINIRFYSNCIIIIRSSLGGYKQAYFLLISQNLIRWGTSPIGKQPTPLGLDP